MFLAALLGVLLGTAGLVFKVQLGYHSPADTLLDGLGGFLFLGAGVVAHVRQPANRVGLLMVMVGAGSFAEDLQLSRTGWVHTAGLLLIRASSGFVTHLVLAFPRGRLASRPERLLVGTAYAAVFVLTPVGALFDDTRRGHVPRTNLLLVAPDPAVSRALDQTVEAIGAVVAAGVVFVLVRRWVRAGQPMRRVLPVFLTGLVGGASTFLYGVLGSDDPFRVANRWVYWTAFCLLPLGFFAWVLRVRLGRTAVGALLAQLREPLSAPELQTALARTLGDPALQVGYWRPDAEAFVDGDGRPLELPQAGSGREVRLVERDGRRVAVLVYDVALREDAHVLDAVTAAAGLALDNQRLTVEVRAQLAEVRASRSRIVTATDAERRRLERDLHDGAQQRLVIAALSLRLAQQRLDGAADPGTCALLANSTANLDAAIRELREFARGVHPAILTEAGLMPALRALAERTPLDVHLAAGGVPRLAPAAEATGYFVVAEALTNVLRHARADHVRVMVEYVECDEGVLRLDVTDDGVGGADISAGSGLLGLRDRVSALDGTLTVRSIAGRGTSVSAVIPCGTAADGSATAGGR